MRLKVDFKVFFEAGKVEKATDRKMNRVLYKTGAYGARTMKQMVRAKPKKKKYVPTPGQAPRWAVKPGLRLTNFGVDKTKKEVAFGAMPYKGSRGWTSYYSDAGVFLKDVRQRPVNKTVPQLVTEGGQALLEQRYPSGLKIDTRLTYRSFPYDDLAMRPTLEFKRQLIEKEPFA